MTTTSHEGGMGPGIDAGQWFFFHSNVQLDTNEKTTIYSEPDNGESSNAACQISGYVRVARAAFSMFVHTRHHLHEHERSIRLSKCKVAFSACRCSTYSESCRHDLSHTMDDTSGGLFVGAASLPAPLPTLHALPAQKFPYFMCVPQNMTAVT